MAGVDEGSRIRDGVRDSKILRDAPSKFNHKSGTFMAESHWALAESRHHLKYDDRRMQRDFPRVSMVGIGDKFQMRHDSLKETNRRWVRSYLPIFSGNSSKRNLLVWIDTVDSFFEEMHPPDKLKCQLAYYALEGAAEQWWQRLQHQRVVEGESKITLWPRMKFLLINDFWPTTCSTKCPLRICNDRLGEKCPFDHSNEFYFTTEIVSPSTQIHIKQVISENLTSTNCLMKVPSQSHINEQKQMQGLGSTDESRCSDSSITEVLTVTKSENDPHDSPKDDALFENKASASNFGANNMHIKKTKYDEALIAELISASQKLLGSESTKHEIQGVKKQTEDLNGAVGFAEEHERNDEQILDEEQDSGKCGDSESLMTGSQPEEYFEALTKETKTALGYTSVGTNHTNTFVVETPAMLPTSFTLTDVPELDHPLKYDFPTHVVPVNPSNLNTPVPVSYVNRLGFNSNISRIGSETGFATKLYDTRGEQSQRKIRLELNNVDFPVSEIQVVNFDPGGVSSQRKFMNDEALPTICCPGNVWQTAPNASEGHERSNAINWEEITWLNLGESMVSRHSGIGTTLLLFDPGGGLISLKFGSHLLPNNNILYINEFQAEDDVEERPLADCKKSRHKSLGSFHACWDAYVESNIRMLEYHFGEVGDLPVANDELMAGYWSKVDVGGTGLKHEIDGFDCFLNLFIQPIIYLTRFQYAKNGPCDVCALLVIFAALKNVSCELYHIVMRWGAGNKQCIGMGPGCVGTMGVKSLMKVWGLDGSAAGIPNLKRKSTVATYEDAINFPTVAPNDNLIYSNCTISIWTLPKLASIVVIREQETRIWLMVFPWVHNGSWLRSFEGHTTNVIVVQFVLYNADCLVKLWTIKTNGCIATYDQHDEILSSTKVLANFSENVGALPVEIAINWQSICIKQLRVVRFDPDESTYSAKKWNPENHSFLSYRLFVINIVTDDMKIDKQGGKFSILDTIGVLLYVVDNEYNLAPLFTRSNSLIENYWTVLLHFLAMVIFLLKVVISLAGNEIKDAHYQGVRVGNARLLNFPWDICFDPINEIMNIAMVSHIITRGRVIPWEGWNDEHNTDTERKFILVELNAVMILCKNGQFLEALKLFHNVVNGLDPPKGYNSGLGSSNVLDLPSSMDSLVDEFFFE